ncbi:hypothetical protein, partial [Bradyrhizobium brasilense]|uniref:hypothetical protein n=1 Tax=Bradyrhizobium brasilense TaxID=1419277 RepID=UPI001E416606
NQPSKNAENAAARNIDAPDGTQVSFSAKRLSLVEQMERNGINKEIRPRDRIARPVVTFD